MGGLLSTLFGGSQNKRQTLSAIQLNDYKIKLEKKIGQGGFAEVFIVSDVNTGKKFALKQFQCLDDEQYNKFAQTELKILQNFKGKSPHIIELLDTDNFQFALLPLYPLGSIQSIIDKQRNSMGLQPFIPIPGQFSKKDILQLAQDICEGLLVFHQNDPPIAHRDVSPGNVLLKEENGKQRAVLMDFGSAAPARVSTEVFASCMKLQEIVELTCSVLYRAPELHEVITHSIVDERSDVWVNRKIWFVLVILTSISLS